MVSAGWYQDPSDPARQRYWDGTQWTEQLQAPPSTTPRGQPPVAYQQQMQAGVATPSAANWGNKPFGPGFGDWFSATFSGFFKGVLPTVGFLLVLNFPLFIVFYALLNSLLGGLLVSGNELNGPTVDGFEFGPLWLALGAACLLGIVLQYVGSLAVHNYMYHVQMEIERSLARSFVSGLKGLPKLVLILVVGGLVSALLVGMIIGLSTVSEAAAGIALLLLVVIAYPAILFLAIRMAYLPITTTLAPEGEGFIRAAWEASRGKFWMILGRTLVLNFIASFVVSIGYIALIFIGVMIVPFNADGNDLVRDDGSIIDTTNGVDITDFLPSIVGVSIMAFVVILLIAATSSLFASGTAAMYIQDQDEQKLRR